MCITQKPPWAWKRSGAAEETMGITPQFKNIFIITIFLRKCKQIFLAPQLFEREPHASWFSALNRNPMFIGVKGYKITVIYDSGEVENIASCLF
jgi:hypothetical protein